MPSPMPPLPPGQDALLRALIAQDAETLVVAAEIVTADISDRAVRLALLYGYLDHEPTTTEAAGYLRCTLPEAAAADAELYATASWLAARHDCGGEEL